MQKTPLYLQGKINKKNEKQRFFEQEKK